MLSGKKAALRSIIESRHGLHLTSYLRHDRKDPATTLTQLRDTVQVATEYLNSQLSADDLQKFLAPVEKLARDRSLLKSIDGNLGLFRTSHSFRILNIPIPVDPACVVATTFHVKPLLRWMQVDRDFLLLIAEENTASLFQGSQTSFRHLDTTVHRDVTIWMNEWLGELSREGKPRIFLAGQPERMIEVAEELHEQNLYFTPLTEPYRADSASTLCGAIRNLLADEARSALENAIVEFYHAEELRYGKRNLFQIAKAAIQGRVRKLIISDGIKIFGKLDEKTGGLAIHPADLDHEDDDLLDDLAQTVLAKGGEVLVAKQGEIPKGHPILAILDRPQPDEQNLLMRKSL